MSPTVSVADITSIKGMTGDVNQNAISANVIEMSVSVNHITRPARNSSRHSDLVNKTAFVQFSHEKEMFINVEM